MNQMRRLRFVAVMVLLISILVCLGIILYQSSFARGRKVDECQPKGELLLCPVCLCAFSTLKKPICLVCGHTCCALCLSNIAQENQIVCPLCREQTRIPKNGLARNYILDSFLEERNSETEEKTETISRESRRELMEQKNCQAFSFFTALAERMGKPQRFLSSLWPLIEGYVLTG